MLFVWVEPESDEYEWAYADGRQAQAAVSTRLLATAWSKFD